MYSIIISNPACGAGTGHEFVLNKVIPLFKENGKEIDQILVTEGPNHAGSVLCGIRRQHQGPIQVILSSGDGTLHEIINALVDDRDYLKGKAVDNDNEFFLALVPSGTANALYSSLYPPSDENEPTTDDYKLKSVYALLKNSPAKPLALAITDLQSSSGKIIKSIVSVVVTSAALHASILHDSEALRKDTPGIERFKIAAMNNITRWYNSRVTLLPTSSDEIFLYDASSKKFTDASSGEHPSQGLTYQGPFEYFLSTVNVDRLEPAFKVTPLHSEIPPEPGTMEIVIVRPLRDKTMRDDSEESRKDFANKAVAVIHSAYNDGAHTSIKYSTTGEVVADGDGLSVVEYIRCSGWEWIPEPTDDHAHILCTDGTIYHIEQGGKARCTAAFHANGLSFAVYAA